LLPVALRGLSSLVGTNMEILLSRILKSQTVGKSVENCVEILLVQGSFAKGKTITTVHAFKNSLAKGR
jgi:urease gamma subunit